MSATHYHPILGGTDQCSHGRSAHVCPLSLTTCHNCPVKVALNQEMYKSFEVDISAKFHGAKDWRIPPRKSRLYLLITRSERALLRFGPLDVKGDNKTSGFVTFRKRERNM